jgi:hypothetical protein
LAAKFGPENSLRHSRSAEPIIRTRPSQAKKQRRRLARRTGPYDLGIGAEAEVRDEGRVVTGFENALVVHSFADDGQAILGDRG